MEAGGFRVAVVVVVVPAACRAFSVVPSRANRAGRTKEAVLSKESNRASMASTSPEQRHMVLCRAPCYQNLLEGLHVCAWRARKHEDGPDSDFQAWGKKAGEL